MKRDHESSRQFHFQVSLEELYLLPRALRVNIDHCPLHVPHVGSRLTCLKSRPQVPVRAPPSPLRRGCRQTTGRAGSAEPHHLSTGGARERAPLKIWARPATGPPPPGKYSPATPLTAKIPADDGRRRRRRGRGGGPRPVRPRTVTGGREMRCVSELSVHLQPQRGKPQHRECQGMSSVLFVLLKHV